VAVCCCRADIANIIRHRTKAPPRLDRCRAYNVIVGGITPACPGVWPHPVPFRFLNFKAPNGVQAGKGQPCSIIRPANLRFVGEIMMVGIHRSIPILHVRIPSIHARPVPASAQTTYPRRKHIPRRHAHCGRLDSHVVCSNPRLDMWIRNMYLCQLGSEDRVIFSVRNVHSQSAFPIRARGFPIFIFEFNGSAC